jgi:4-diphosphocytidyl-2-C-methyl-D-erythritol kinase
MTSFSLDAPAKINLSLRVVARRDDGFHDIDTLMVKLPGLADVIEFADAPEFSFHCDAPEMPAHDDNLVVRAIRAYEQAAGFPCPCAITLHKRIPHGAGLAGGSSDAAATLLGINRLKGFKLGVEALHEVASSLGSDVPFFLTTGAARCTGRGERIQPIPPIPALPILLLKPSFAVATPDAYRHWKDSAEIPGIRYSPQRIGENLLFNDLERPVFQKHRFLAELKAWLLQRSETSAALMSGSGSTVFAVLNDRSLADPLAAAARTELDPGLWSWSGTTE